MQKTNLPLISVCVINYNGSAYLEQSIGSIVNQTYKNLEIVFCDDASTDNSINLFESIVKDTPHIKVVKQYNKKNLGVEKNMLKGLRAFTGEYVCNLDGDDILLSNHIETLYSLIKSSGADISSTNHIEFSEKINGNSIASVEKRRKNLENIQSKTYRTEEALETLFLQQQFIPFAYWHRLYKRQFAKKVSALPDNYFQNSDSAFSLAQLCEAKSIAYIDYPTYLYRHIDSSVSHKSWYAYVSKKTLHSLDRLSAFYSKNNAALLSLNEKRNAKAIAWMIRAVTNEKLGYKEYKLCIEKNMNNFIRHVVAIYLSKEAKSHFKKSLAYWCFLKNYTAYYLVSRWLY